MDKTTQVVVTVSVERAAAFKNERRTLELRLEQLFIEARAIEDAIGVPTRIKLAPPAVEAVGAPEPTLEEVAEFKEPRGGIMRKVWEHLVEHPGLTMQELRKALRMQDVQLATAVNSMLRKHGQLTVIGDRGAYRYYAVKAKK
jgi:hypothetical protein